jgi:hypothetical protein
VSTLPACAKAVIVATALVPGAVLTSVVRISATSASLPGVREPTLPDRPALAAAGSSPSEADLPAGPANHRDLVMTCHLRVGHRWPL